MWDIIVWILFGGAAGVVAGWVLGDKRGIVGDVIVGIVGSFLAGWAGTGFKSFTSTGFSFMGFLTSVLGAVVFIALLNVLKGKRMR